MKRLTQFVCLVLVMSLVMAVPAHAAGPAPRASDYFGFSSCYLWKTSANTFAVCFDVTAVATMQKLGASVIKVQRSTDQQNWTTVQTYTMENYPSLVASNTGNHLGEVSYTGSTGYYYRGYVELYAKNSYGTAIYPNYTSSIRL